MFNFNKRGGNKQGSVQTSFGASHREASPSEETLARGSRSAVSFSLRDLC